MTTLTLRSPSLMGRNAFEQIFDQVFGDQRNMIKQSTSGYPITDIYKDDNNNQVIEMALAGFTKEDINIEVRENKISIIDAKSLYEPTTCTQWSPNSSEHIIDHSEHVERTI